MINIVCSRDGLECGDCPIFEECDNIELTEVIDCYSLFEKGRADAIDECIKILAESEDTILSDRQYYTLMELKERDK